MPAGKEVGEGFALAEADLEGEKAAEAESCVGSGDEAAVDVEAVLTGEEGGVGFVGEDFGLQGGGVGEGYVRGVGDDGVVVGIGGWEEIGVEEVDVGEVVSGGVFAGEVEGGFRYVGGDDLGGGKVGCEGYGDGAGACADVGYA